MSGFLIGLGQGLNNVGNSLQGFMEMQRQARLDALNKQVAQSNMAHTNAVTEGLNSDNAFGKWLDSITGIGGQQGPPPAPPIPSLGVGGPGGAVPAPSIPIPSGPQPIKSLSDLDPNDTDVRAAFERHHLNANQTLGPLTSTKPPSATIGRAVAAVDSAMGPMAELEKLTAAHNPSDPSGEHTGVMHLLGDKAEQFWQGAKYKLGFPVPQEGGLTPDDERVRQMTNFVKVMAANPLMQGSRNFQMMQLIMEHLPDAEGTPEAQHQRIVTAMTLLPKVREDLLNSGRPIGQQLKTAGPVQMNPGAATANMPQAQPAPQGAAPQAVAPSGGGAKVMSSQRFMQYKAINPGVPDDQLKARLQASGWTVQ
jgi:hypothetical protein